MSDIKILEIFLDDETLKISIKKDRILNKLSLKQRIDLLENLSSAVDKIDFYFRTIDLQKRKKIKTKGDEL